MYNYDNRFSIQIALLKHKEKVQPMPKKSKLSRSILFLILIVLLFMPSTGQASRLVSLIPGYDCYRDSQTVAQRVSVLQNNYPDLVQTRTIGNSFEQRPIQSIRITGSNPSVNKPRLILISGLRANAFAPVELHLGFIERLLSEYGIDPISSSILDFYEIYSVLIANPDGRLRAESQAQAGLEITWQNNTNPNYCASSPKGVALNTNFPFAWSESYSDPCNPNYQGPSAASEPETRAITSFLTDLVTDSKPSLLLHLDSYEDLIMTPYLYDGTAPNPNEYSLYTLANKLAYGTSADPVVGNGEFGLDRHGTLLDFAYGELELPSLAYNMGDRRAGGYTSDCWYFNEELLEPTLEALNRAALAGFSAYQSPFGPETVIEKVQIKGNTIQIEGFSDDYSFYKQMGNDYTSVKRLTWSVGVPPWHPQAEVGEVSSLAPVQGFPFRSTFRLVLPFSELEPGEYLLHLQAWDEAGAGQTSKPGLVASVWIEVPELRYLPLLIK